MSVVDGERRQQLVQLLLSWLDDVAESEAPPPGLVPELAGSAEPAPDLFTLLGQLTALTRETQLVGRATSRLHVELSQTLEQLAASAGGPEALTRKLAEARREGRAEVAVELLDVRDRLSRGLAEAERRLAALRGIRAWLGQRPVLEALIEGNRFARERLDDLLGRLDVREIACLGLPFDPTLMQAAEVVKESSAPPGTVIEVFRPGYTGNGRVIRFAEVKVAAGLSPALERDDHD